MDTFEKLKQGAGRAAFEADRRLRLARVESRIGSIKQAMSVQFTQLGEATYQLYKQEALVERGLVTLSEQVRATERQLEEAQAEAERIRLEAAPAPVGLLVGHVCLRCQVKLPAEAVFCPRCGGPASDIEPPVAATIGGATKSCPSCGRSIPQEARFCPGCGSDVSVPPAQGEEKVEAAPETTVCPECGKELPAGAVFCSQCGATIRDQPQAGEPVSSGLDDEGGTRLAGDGEIQQ